MDVREYVIDTELHRDRLLRILVNGDIPNPAGLVATLFAKTIPTGNGGLPQAIHYLMESVDLKDVRWQVLETLTYLWGDLQVPCLVTDEVCYQYISSRDAVRVTVITPVDKMTPCQWINQLERSGYHVDTNTRRVFEQYQHECFGPQSGTGICNDWSG